MPVAGGGGGAAYVSIQECAQLARAAGIPNNQLVTCVAIAMAESGLNIFATGYNGPTTGCPNGSRDRGLWQINDCYNPDVSDGCAYSASCNASAMARIFSHGTNWHRWSTFNSGAYLSHVGAVNSALGSLGQGSGSGNIAAAPYDPVADLRHGIAVGMNPIGAAFVVFQRMIGYTLQKAGL